MGQVGQIHYREDGGAYVLPDEIQILGGNAYWVYNFPAPGGFPNAAGGEEEGGQEEEQEEELGTAADHELVPEAPAPIDEGEQPEGHPEHLEVTTSFLHGCPTLLYYFLFGIRADLSAGNTGRLEPKK